MVKQIKIDENNVVLGCSIGGLIEGGIDVEDIPDDILKKKYGGDEQKYIDDNYDIENYSWDYITESLFLPAGEYDFYDIDFDTILD